ncbi:transcription factor S [[Eubacterium] cellulosolvens]
MKFCPKCGSLLIPVQKDEKVIIKCTKCLYVSEKPVKTISRMKRDAEKIVVIGKEAQKIRTLPTASVECPRCGHNEASYWIVQTRGTDESSTQFFRCLKCGVTWRETS